MSTQTAVIGLKAHACAAQELSKMSGFSEPLSENQRQLVELLLASAYATGMIDGIAYLRNELTEPTS